MSKYQNIISSIIYYDLTITLDVSSIGTHTHLLVLVIYCRIIRLYCLQPMVLGIILMSLNQGMSFAQDYTQPEVFLERRDPADINLLCYNTFLNLDSAIIIYLRYWIWSCMRC
jgi:hypothetical protein